MTYGILSHCQNTQSMLVTNRYLRPRGIQKAMWRETRSLVSLKYSFRIIMALVTHFNLELHQMDVKIAFFQWWDWWDNLYDATRKLWVRRPKEQGLKLEKSIYKLKQACRQWYFKFHQVVASFSFQKNLVDDCIYHKFFKRKHVFLTFSLPTTVEPYWKKFIATNFEMKDLGDAFLVLGMQIHQDRPWDFLELS